MSIVSGCGVWIVHGIYVQRLLRTHELRADERNLASYIYLVAMDDEFYHSRKPCTIGKLVGQW